ncbi:hypothetical protein A3842_23865 [Paenibacillus sp. P3E]|nr:hypothetical protein A3842_23865 [Paenibacillus sp. P3E]
MIPPEGYGEANASQNNSQNKLREWPSITNSCDVSCLRDNFPNFTHTALPIINLSQGSGQPLRRDGIGGCRYKRQDQFGLEGRGIVEYT